MLVYPMGVSKNSQGAFSGEGIIVEASLDVMRKAVERVLFEFHEKVVTKDGKAGTDTENVGIGDSIIFEEKVHCPARIVLTKISEDRWYVISTSDVPTGGYPSGVDAMRAAQAEEKKLRIIKEFLSKTKGVKKVEDVRSWEPDMRAEAADVLNIVKSANRKWSH
jgi:hypothetical protein